MGLFKDLFKVEHCDNLCVDGLNSELYAVYISNLFRKSNKNIVVVTNSLYEANDIHSRVLNYTDDVLYFPMDDFLTSEALSISPEFMIERINTLNNLVNSSKKYIIITNLMGILRYLPSTSTWKNSFINIKKDNDYDREKLLSDLVNLGYRRESVVSETGTFAVRGYVIDVFPLGEDNPVRLEFWGDTIESIKFFNVDSQMTKRDVDNIKICPYTEFIVDNYSEDVIRKQKYLKTYSKCVNNLYDYTDKGICVYYDYGQLLSAYKMLKESILEYVDIDSDFKSNYMFDLEDINFSNEVYFLKTDNYIDKKDLFREKYKCNNIDNYNGNDKKLFENVNNYIIGGKTVILCLENQSSINRIIDLFDNKVFLTDENKIIKNKINVLNKRIGNGFKLDDYVVIGQRDIFDNNIVRYKSNVRYKLGSKITNLNNINQGDYIVHEMFGVGIYDKLCNITKRGVKKDYIKLIYLDNDVLYIPVENIDRISKYSGKEGASFKLDKIGSDSWAKKKLKVKKQLEDIAGDLLKVSVERQSQEGYAFSKDDEYQQMFESEFVYTETPDQLKASDLIKKEMEKKKPMDMLLCGDVGYGKTEVAFRAIFKAINDGKQVAYLCPTTILSNQQYKSALERFQNFSCNIGLLNRFVPKKKQDEIVQKVKEGKIDLLFGTHRILSNDIEFKDLGLLIVDEEQRFGVTHKEKIKKLKSTVDILTLSATPIPRTLQMSMTGVRSLALIETPPKERYPIQTYVLPENNNVIKDAIYKELSRDGQVFILYNRVEHIMDKVNEIKRLVPEARIDFAHGQMTKTELEDKMNDFINYKFDVLVCTTIIETGIDIPNANTLIIIDADRYGLSQLYQIRGRIGRSNKIGYAYLMYDNKKMLNDIAIKRLDTIKEFTELGSGFKIAMRDLSIRGAGDILGREQSGYIDSVGIDLYLKMLNDSINKLKGIEVKEEEKDKQPLIDVDTHISDDYIKDEDLKIDIHKKINEIDSYEKIEELKNELIDRFGNVSEELEIYMYEEWFEKLADKLNIKKVVQNTSFIEIKLDNDISSKIDGEKLFYKAYDISKCFRFKYDNGNIIIILDTIKLDEHFIKYLIKILLLIIDGEVCR